ASAVRFPRADLERLVALRPDLVVLSQFTDADFLRLVEKSGLRHHRLQGLESLAGMRASVLELGRLVGESAGAERLVARVDATLAELDRRLTGAPRPRVLYWANPHTAGRNTSYGAIIEAAGATNVGRELGLEGILPLSAERAFRADPDYVLLGQWEGSGA